MAEIILYPGSFNPVHNGHTAVAEYTANSGLCDELWMLVSPQSPFKQDENIAPGPDRLEMTRIAVEEQISVQNVKVSDVEFGLPKPSYTVETLRYLGKEFPSIKFSLLIGTDILTGIHRWHEAEYILSNYKIYVYPRRGTDFEKLSPGMTFLGGAPQVDISSTAIRKALEDGGSLAGMLSRGVITYIYDKGLWVSDAAHRRLNALDKEVNNNGGDAALFLERGLLNYKFTEYSKALNDFLKAEDLQPGNKEANEYIKLLRDIFEFRNMDIYNP